MDNLEHILAIELMNAAQGIEFRRPEKTSPRLERFLTEYRKEVPFVKDDIVMYKEIHKTVCFPQPYKVRLLKTAFFFACKQHSIQGKQQRIYPGDLSEYIRCLSIITLMLTRKLFRRIVVFLFLQ